MGISDLSRSRKSQPKLLFSVACLSLTLLSLSPKVLAHAGHGEHFQENETATTTQPDAIQVDAATAKRLGIKVEPVSEQRLAVGMKTTGQIETLPNRKVEVTAPVSKAIVVKLLVEPGASVQAGQPVAVLAAPDLVDLRVTAQEKSAEATADVQQARANLNLAQQNLERQRQIAAAEIEQAQTEANVAQEQYDRDRDLTIAGAIPRRQLLESQAHLEEGKTQLARAAAHKEVIAAEAELKRAQAALSVAQSRLRLSNTTYQTRLQQLGAKANAKGLVTVTAPIAGRIADRPATLGQSFEDAGGKLMTAFTSALGLAPLVIGQGAGKEILQPLAVVVLGGLFTSTALTMNYLRTPLSLRPRFPTLHLVLLPKASTISWGFR
jgi:cobalt-zinc-cadmium efflux system membrane fusion protein